MRRFLVTPAGRGIVILLVGLAVGALLQANALRKQAETQTSGRERTVALALTRPLVSVSRTLHLTAPRSGLQALTGRRDEDTVDTEVHLASSPRTSARTAPRRSPSTAAHPAGTKPKPAFTATRPLRVWVAGDSLAEVPGQALQRLSDPALKVVGVESRLSTGLARPDLYNWFTRVEQAEAQLRPDVVVFSFGADDAHDFMAGVPDGKAVGPFGSPSWIAEYRRRVDGVTRELASRGSYVVWLGLPIPDGSGFKQSFPVINRILRSVVADNRNSSAFIDTWHHLDDFHGRYAAYLRVHGKLTLLRLPDGVHYTAAAGDLIAGLVMPVLHARYRF